MITLQDCIGLCDLSPAEVQAIGEHEHLPEMIAASLGNYLLHEAHGPEKVRDMIIDDIRVSTRRGDTPHARHLVAVLRRFLRDHPPAAFRHVDA